MAVDYKTGKAPATVVQADKLESATTTVVEQAKAVEFAVSDLMPAPRPSEIDVFLALLVAHTTAAGGSKYWGVTKNVPGNVSRLKSLAQQIVEAY